jgi:hypothetical protein
MEVPWDDSRPFYAVRQSTPSLWVGRGGESVSVVLGTSCRSPLAGDALLVVPALGAKSVRSPTAHESLFSCVAKRKVTKRERPPRLALAGLLPGKSVSRGRAFRQGLLPWRKGVDIPVDSRCAACRPRLTAAQGPQVEQRASCAYVSEEPEQSDASLSAPSPSAGQDGPPLFPGPLCSGGRVEESPQGGSQGCEPV